MGGGGSHARERRHPSTYETAGDAGIMRQPRAQIKCWQDLNGL